MIAVVSPAKTFAPEPLVAPEPTRPHFAADASRLAKAARDLRAEDLERLMHISPELAALNVDRYASFRRAEARPAIAAFHGDVYRGLDAATMSDDALAFADGHLRILSGLYGLLRPTDAIRPYRLEMGTAWAPDGGDLYGFWGNKVARRLEREARATGAPLILNLASKEYWHVVEPHLARRTRVVAADFRDRTASGLRFNTFAAKKARGALARYMCEGRAEAPEALTDWTGEGYAFAGFAGDVMRFVR